MPIEHACSPSPCPRCSHAAAPASTCRSLRSLAHSHAATFLQPSCNPPHLTSTSTATTLTLALTRRLPHHTALRASAAARRPLAPSCVPPRRHRRRRARCRRAIHARKERTAAPRRHAADRPVGRGGGWFHPDQRRARRSLVAARRDRPAVAPLRRGGVSERLGSVEGRASGP